MKLEFRLADQVTFLVFSETRSENDAVYSIENKLYNVRVEVYQAELDQQIRDSPNPDHYKIVVPGDSMSFFAWERQPVANKNIVVKLRFEGLLEQEFDQDEIVFNLDENDDVENQFEVPSM